MYRRSLCLFEQYSGNVGSVWIEKTKVADICHWEVKYYLVRGESDWYYLLHGPDVRKGFCNCAWKTQIQPEVYKSVMDGDYVWVDLELKDKQDITYRTKTSLVLKRVFDEEEHEDNIAVLEMKMIYLRELKPV